MAISRLKVLNSNMWVGFLTVLGTWNTQNQLAVTFEALTLIGDWEKMLEDIVFIGSCPGITSSGLLPL